MDYLVEIKKLAAVIILSLAANTGVIAFSRRTADISPQFEPLTYTSIGFVTILSALGAYFTLQLLKKYTDNPIEYFFYISGLVLIASFGPIGHIALNLPEAGMAEANILGLTHVVAAVFIVGTLVKFETLSQRKKPYRT